MSGMNWVGDLIQLLTDEGLVEEWWQAEEVLECR